MYFRQFWNDDRLNFEKIPPSNVEQLAAAALKTKVWVPDPFFANQEPIL
jgi:Neurotransmitter-gated ion-channel ligand binding domain